MNKLEALEEALRYRTAPTLAEMPRRGLADKGIGGPTAAHVIEEIHTPRNLAFVTATTGSTAFQNLVGVVRAELPEREAASDRALALAGLGRGDHIVITYPPLVNLFPREALESRGITWSFLEASTRDDLLLSLCKRKPRAVLGESSFLRAALEDGLRLLGDLLPRGLVALCAGTPLDMEILPLVEGLGGRVHDLYGCQEFGWLALDGVPLREDLCLIPQGQGRYHLIAGGLPTGDCFPVAEGGHVCGGSIVTYARERRGGEPEVWVEATTASSRETVERLARTILRIKAKIVRASPDLETGAGETRLLLAPYGQREGGFAVTGPRARLFDRLLEAQMDYQRMDKGDPAWNKQR